MARHHERSSTVDTQRCSFDARVWLGCRSGARGCGCHHGATHARTFNCSLALRDHVVGCTGTCAHTPTSHMAPRNRSDPCRRVALGLRCCCVLRTHTSNHSHRFLGDDCRIGRCKRGGSCSAISITYHHVACCAFATFRRCGGVSSTDRTSGSQRCSVRETTA
jgi:hypothetical protein